MNVYELMATLSLDTKDFENKLHESEGTAERSGIGSKLVSIGKTAGKVLTASTAVVASGVSAVTAMAVKGYASYEQLAGGVEKLFGENVAKTVTENAKKAYMTSGKNMNEYMESVTSFSAALIKSLGGDTEKAAAQADKALTDMADNVNTFGTSAEAVENAYKGFAKANYTMLDNLNLGYAGTKEGMQQLLTDAEKLSGVKYNLSSYSDIVDAIHVIQEDMHIAGTTAKEAANTIEGSFNMTKSALQNLIQGLGNSDADIGELVSNVIESAGYLGQQVIPTVQRVFGGLGSAVEEMAPQIVASIPKVFGEITTGLIGATFSMLNTTGSAVKEYLPELLSSIGEGLTSNLGMFSNTAFTFVEQIVNGIITYAPMMVDTAVSFVESFSQGFTTGIPTLLSKALPMILTFTQMVRENAGKLIGAGLIMIMNIAKGIINSIPLLISYVPEIITNIAGIINDNAPKILITGVGIIGELIKGIIKSIPLIVQNIPKIIEAIIAVFQAFNWINLGSSIIKAIANGIKSLASSLPSALKGIAKTASSGFKSFNWSNIGMSVVRAIVTGIKGLASSIPTALKTIGRTALTAFKSISWSSLGANIISGIVSGITHGAGSLFTSLKNLAGNALSAAKNKLGIHSPSRVFRDQVGKMISAGIAKGIEDNDSPIKAMRRLSDYLFGETYDISPMYSTVNRNGIAPGTNKTNYFNINMTVDGTEDPEKWAGEFVDELERMERMGFA